MRILFTGVGRRVELIQAFREAALVLNKELKIYGVDIDRTAPALAYCDYTRQIVSMDNPLYIDELLSICYENHIDLVVPTLDTDLLILSENKSLFDSINTQVMVSNTDVIQMCWDKILTSRVFKECGLKTPTTVTDWKEYKEAYPAFIKPRTGSGSVNANGVEDERKLEFYADQIENYIVQPFIHGREYTIDILCDWDGNPVTIVPRERLQVREGEVLKARIDVDSQIMEECRKICSKLKPCGPITIQLIRDNADVDWFIEINPRFGGGAPLSMKAGARSAEAVLRMMEGEATGKYESTDKAVYSRFDQSVCITEGKLPIKGVVFDLDDTLYNEKEYVRSGFKAVSDYLGGGYEYQLWESFVSGKLAIDELLKVLGREDEIADVLSIYRIHKPNIHLNAGVIEMLSELKRKNIRVGIITDGRPETQRNKIKALGLEVDDVIITDELGGVQFRKPCDISFRIMATRWRLSPSEMVYVGDNPDKDFQAPRQLGMQTVWIQNAEGLYCSDNDISNSIYQHRGKEMPIEEQNSVIEIIHKCLKRRRVQ